MIGVPVRQCAGEQAIFVTLMEKPIVAIDARDAWSTTLDRLELRWDRASIETWLRPTEFLRFEANRLVIGVPNSTIGDMLSRTLYHDLRQTVCEAMERDLELDFEIQGAQPPAPSMNEEMPLFRLLSRQDDPDKDVTARSLQEALRSPEACALPESAINPQMVFERFIVNESNHLASDRHPRELETLEDRLRSRFQGGLVADIAPPEYETRVAIMELWANERNLQAPLEVLHMIAERSSSCIRELNGLFNQIAARLRWRGGDALSMSHAEASLDRYEKPTEQITVASIVEVIAAAFNLETAAILGKKRMARINHARQLAMFLAREMTESISSAAATPPSHGCNKIEAEIAATDRRYLRPQPHHRLAWLQQDRSGNRDGCHVSNSRTALAQSNLAGVERRPQARSNCNPALYIGEWKGVARGDAPFLSLSWEGSVAR